jgi:hypothetical protein
MYNMKITNIRLIILAVVVIIAISLMLTPGVLPYSSNDLFSKEYKYEGFSGLSYTSADKNAAMDTDSSLLIVNDTSECKKVYGFEGLFCRPDSVDKKNDAFADTKGSLSAFGVSSGLSNSTGSLVLSPEQVRLLRTRGGNQSSAPAEIGSK